MKTRWGNNVMNTKIKIFTCLHKPAQFIHNDIITPIQIGAAKSSKKIPGVSLTDDTGDNRSIRDIEYGELTAQYWAWKNVEADYYGFFHYRRYLNFTENQYDEDPYGVVLESKSIDKVVGKYGLDEETIREVTSGYDILISRKVDCRKQPEAKMNEIEQYTSAPYMHDKTGDIDILLEILNDLFPQYYQFAYKFFKDSYMSYFNIFVMRKKLFFDYSNWLFTILDEFERRVDTSKYSAYASRTPGFIAERLLNIFCMYEAHFNKDLKIKELQVVYFKNTELREKMSPAFPKESALIVTSSGDYYAPILSVWLQSILDYSNSEHNYDIVVLEEGISQNNRQLLQSMVAKYPNICLRFCNVAAQLKGLNWNNWNHTNCLTYARFLIPELFPDREKAIWSDADLVFRRDPFDLYSEDVSDYFLAATKDVRSSGMLNYPSDPQMKNFTEILKLDDPYSYFQAGVMLLNLEKFRRHFTTEFFLHEAKRTDLRWLDQDILNILCQGQVKFLKLNWNVTVPAHIPIETFAPADIEQEYKLAQEAPWVIHYAGNLLPISKPDVSYACDFWQCARRTPYYEILIARMITTLQSANHNSLDNPLVNQSVPYVSDIRKWADHWLPKGSKRRAIAKKICPKGTRRWEFLRKIYNTFKGIK